MKMQTTYSSLARFHLGFVVDCAVEAWMGLKGKEATDGWSHVLCSTRKFNNREEKEKSEAFNMGCGFVGHIGYLQVAIE